MKDDLEVIIDIPVTAPPRKLKCKWTPELQKEIEIYYMEKEPEGMVPVRIPKK
jgi:hypothetical protein